MQGALKRSATHVLSVGPDDAHRVPLPPPAAITVLAPCSPPPGFSVPLRHTPLHLQQRINELTPDEYSAFADEVQTLVDGFFRGDETCDPDKLFYGGMSVHVARQRIAKLRRQRRSE